MKDLEKSNGFIKLHRESLKNPVFRKPLAWHYFEYCLLKANHKSEVIIWNKKEMIIERGSFITGRKKAAKETGLSEQNIRTASTTLLSLGMIEKSTSKSTSKFTYLTICNYDKWNPPQTKTNHETNQQPTSNQPATNQQLTTNKKYKNDKNVKKKEKAFCSEQSETVSEQQKYKFEQYEWGKEVREILSKYHSLELVNLDTKTNCEFWDGHVDLMDGYFSNNDSMTRWFKLEMANIDQWQRENPQRASRTPSGLRRRINSWLMKEYQKLETRR